ncbi:unnamed protein product [Rotaria magnacalcarata]|uniref:Uncharacterized protein n=1 Tax=Rotaria magnacalcarata TaxID=392030 RepID=A0A815D388_9BILA|nr:unnamed protein product [Rotaria magnacalcarata]
MRTVATIVSISLVLLFVILCIQEDGIFKFHPSLMAVSYLGFMFQAINIFSVDNTSRSSSISKRKQILIHSLFQQSILGKNRATNHILLAGTA